MSATWSTITLPISAGGGLSAVNSFISCMVYSFSISQLHSLEGGEVVGSAVSLEEYVHDI